MTYGSQQDISMTEIGKTRKSNPTLETTALWSHNFKTEIKRHH
jgi:hypothetical protein